MLSQRDCVKGLEVEAGPLDEMTLSAVLSLADICVVRGYEEEALLWYRKAVAGYKTNLDGRSAKAMTAEMKIQELENRGVKVRDV